MAKKENKLIAKTDVASLLGHGRTADTIRQHVETEDKVGGEIQTPIEVALGVDENGMTTARKLYAFLELRQKDFARWCKRNIIENEFATENEDYFRLRIDAETPTGGKIQREDYRLSASFAKKLSMMSKTEKGEIARQYFIKVEDGMKEVARRL